MDNNNFPPKKKSKGVLNFSESQTLITQSHFIVNYMQSNLILQKKIKEIHHLRYTRPKKKKNLNKDDKGKNVLLSKTLQYL